MMQPLALALLLLLPAAAQQPAPQFTIDLDLPPAQRHWAVAEWFKKDYPGFMTAWEASLSRKVSAEERADWMAHHNVKQEYQDEIQGFVDQIGSPEVTFERVMLFNLMYELHFPTFCSGVLATDSSGRVMHGRNLDVVMSFKSGGKAMAISEMTVNLTYVKGGRPAFNAIAFAGHVGLQTVLKLNGHHPWSFQQNSHYDNDRHLNLAAMKEGAVPYSFFMRDLIMQDIDFRAAVLMIESTPFSAPNYFLMAGASNWEGASIEIKRKSTDTYANLASAQVLSPQIGRWYIVQTNDRVWEDPQDDRRPAANEMLMRLESTGVNEDTLMRLMRSRPLYNDYTSLSLVATPSTGYVRALTRKEAFPELNLLAKNRRFKTFLR